MGVSDDVSEEEARADNAAIMDELKNRLRKAENASEEYQRQLSLLQMRLNDTLLEQGVLEERLQERIGKMEMLENEKIQAAREKREMENQFEAERVAVMKDNEQRKLVEEELQLANQRLKDSLAQREARHAVDEEKVLECKVIPAIDHSKARCLTVPLANSRSRSSPEIENGQFAPPSSLHRNDSKSSSRLAIQKDRVIETLRFELAEAQIKVAELENLGGGRMHELEKKLLETRIANARLTEDNESFQLLLSEKTLNGDFHRAELMHGSAGLGSLAEELETAEGESENYRRLELEAKSLKDQNKALTLYIESIIGRLLQHKEFENILDKTPDLMSGAPRPSAPNREKELPPPPPKDVEPAPSLLQRAKSVVRSRPVSQVVPQASAPKPQPEEEPKSPGIALAHPAPRRDSNHRRSQSDMAYAGSLVNQMYRGPPSGGSGGPMSPGLTPGGMAGKTSYFAPAVGSRNPSSSSRTASASRTTQEQSGSSSNSTFSNHSAEVGNSSPPRASGGMNNNYTGAVMTQSKLRPLRLVQENQEPDGRTAETEEKEQAARKKANRSSWIPGWMNLGKAEEGGRPSSAGNGVS